MALEAVVHPQIPFNYINTLYDHGLISNLDHDHHQEQYSGSEHINPWEYFLGNQTESSPDYYNYYYQDNHNPSSTSSLPHFEDLRLSGDPSPPESVVDGSPSAAAADKHFQPFDDVAGGIGGARAKRRRSRSRKNKEDIENQRMTHIAVERNRRKQMNEYLSVLRSLMPESYVQRGDQASIIGGAINFVKELEQKVQFLGVHKENKGSDEGGSASSEPFSEFFAFPQYSVSGLGADPETRPGVADVEATMVESHANVKIRSKRRPRQLLKLVSGLQATCLTILHLNVTTVEEFVLYSLSLKVEDDCKLNSVDEIATAVYQILARVDEESEINVITSN